MGYSNLQLIERIVAQGLTTGAPEQLGTPVDLLKIGNVFDTNQVPTSIVEQYIQLADSQIDATLSELYVTPFCEKTNYETTLLASIDEYNNYVITSNQCPFYPGDVLIITNGSTEDRVIVDSIVSIDSSNVFNLVSPTSNFYDAVNTRVLRIAYPDPITLISARLAAANIYEKYFMAQSSPNESEYGKLLRKLARGDINNILNGRTILHGQTRIGRRFYNSTLVDRYGLPNASGGENNNIDDVG